MSLPTVSKVVNGRPDVAPSTRARVEQLLVQHQYPRNGQRAARRSGLIDLVFAGLDSPWAVEILRGVEEWGARALDRDRGVLRPARRRPAGQLDVGDRQPSLRRGDPGDHHADRRAGRAAAQGRASRSSSSTRPTRRRRTSRRSARRTGPAGSPPPSTCCPSGTGGSAMITGSADMLCSLARLDGYRSSLERAGVTVDPALIKYGDFEHEGGFARAVELLDLPDRPTAIFAGQRPAGVRRLRGGPPARAAHPRGPVRRRVRRAAGQPLGLAADDHRAPAARGDGQRRRPDARRADRRPAAAVQPGGAVHRAHRPRVDRSRWPDRISCPGSPVARQSRHPQRRARDPDRRRNLARPRRCRSTSESPTCSAG